MALSQGENASKFRSEAVYLLVNPSLGPCAGCVLSSHFSFSCVSQEGPGEESQQLAGEVWSGIYGDYFIPLFLF